MTSRAFIPHANLFRRIFATLALLAMLLRGVVPVGAMPLAAPGAGDGIFPIAICASGFAKTVWLDANGQPVHPPAGEARDHADAPCAFCASSIGAPAEAAAPLAIFLEMAMPKAAPVVAVPARALAFLPDSHGPPQI